jgi:hypothetical protein
MGSHVLFKRYDCSFRTFQCLNFDLKEADVPYTLSARGTAAGFRRVGEGRSRRRALV